MPTFKLQEANIYEKTWVPVAIFATPELAAEECDPFQSWPPCYQQNLEGLERYAYALDYCRNY